MSEQPPPYQPHPQGPPPPPPTSSTDAAGFLRALFDFSFNEFVTPKVVKFVYILATIGVVGGWALITLLTFTDSVGMASCSCCSVRSA